MPSTLTVTLTRTFPDAMSLPLVPQVVFHVHRPLLANVAPPAPAAPAEEGEIEEGGPAVLEGEHPSYPFVQILPPWG